MPVFVPILILETIFTNHQTLSTTQTIDENDVIIYDSVKLINKYIYYIWLC
jgi:hypothetical protein